MVVTDDETKILFLFELVYIEFFLLLLLFSFYSVVLVSAIHESAIIIHILPSSGASLPSPIHPWKSSQSARLGSLCYTATTSLPISILHCIFKQPAKPLGYKYLLSGSHRTVRLDLLALEVSAVKKKITETSKGSMNCKSSRTFRLRGCSGRM